MLIIVLVVGMALAIVLIALLASAKTIVPYALGAALVALVIGLLVKTQPGIANTKKWAGLATAVAVVVMAVLFINAGAVASKNLAPGQAYVAKLAQIEAIAAQPGRADWVVAARNVAMSMQSEDARKRLNLKVLQLAAGTPPSAELTPVDLALTEQLFAEQHGPLENDQKVINCHAHSARIMLAKTGPADVANVLQRYSVAEPICQGRLVFATLVQRACSDKLSRWGKRCAADLPREQLRTSAQGADRQLTDLVDQLLRQIDKP